MATNLTIDNFIQLSSNGIDVMDYTDIVKTIFNKYKEIYGAQIELDPRSGDGRFIYAIATIINSGCQVISQLYKNMNPSTATGNFLDILSSITNVHREFATYSQAKLKIMNNTDSDVTISSIDSLYTKDDDGNEWIPTNDITFPIIISSKSSIELVYSPTDIDVKNTSSLLFLTLDESNQSLTTNIEVFERGSDTESDNSLRYRRSSDSSYGFTILEGVQGKLKNIFGVDDSIIQTYSGNSDESSICYVDNNPTIMPLHSISILLRYNKINLPNKSKIAETIKNNITAGVSTNGTTSFYSLSSTKVATSVNWYVLTKQTPKITIRLSNLYNFAGITTANKIAESIIDYLNNLKISQTYTLADLLSVCQYADPKYMSRATYQVSNVLGLFDEDNQLNKGCYFDYGSRIGLDYKVTLSTDNTTITIEVL